MATSPATQAVRDALELEHGPDALGAYVGTHEATGAASFVADCWDQATALVGDYLGTTELVAAVDPDLLARAVLEAGSELYHRKDAPQGVYMFAGESGGPVRVSRDPLVAVRPLLGAYVGPGMA